MSYVKQKRAQKQEQAPDPYPEDGAIRCPMAEKMNVEFVVNEDAEIWVLHDQPFPAILHWVEYDQETNIVTFVTHDGKIQDLGMVIAKPVGEILIDADEICAMLMQDGQIRDIGIVPVIVRETVFH